MLLRDEDTENLSVGRAENGDRLGLGTIQPHSPRGWELGGGWGEKGCGSPGGPGKMSSLQKGREGTPMVGAVPAGGLGELCRTRETGMGLLVQHPCTWPNTQWPVLSHTGDISAASLRLALPRIYS